MSASEESKGKAAAPVPFFRLDIIRKRHEFKAANGGARFSTPGFTALRSPQARGEGVRFGFTVTKKLGKAVLRNRIRRRLRAAALAALKAAGPALPPVPMDIVVLARAASADLPFATLSTDLARALEALVRKNSEGDGRKNNSGGGRKPPGNPADAKAKLGKAPPVP